ncbi:MAG: hypothetical protein QOE75_461 [Solirubrobacterales bacterium]|nr:hypothetical protein [Solirubrobacterales bacterium]
MLSQHSHWMAAVLAASPGAVLSHRSAAALWGIRSNHGGPIDVTSPSKAKSHRLIRRHEGGLPPDEVTIRDGIPVTTVPRTIFDLAAESPQAVEPALRQAEYLRLYDSLSLLDLLDRYRGHRGNRAIRAALARLKETPGRTRSDFEERFVAFLDRYGLPRPYFNAWIQLEFDRFQADCLWPDQRLIVELDSWSAHGTRSAFRNDKARDRKLAVAGYTTTRIPWAALDDEPAEIAADLHRLLGLNRTDPPRNHT